MFSSLFCSIFHEDITPSSTSISYFDLPKCTVLRADQFRMFLRAAAPSGIFELPLADLCYEPVMLLPLAGQNSWPWLCTMSQQRRETQHIWVQCLKQSGWSLNLLPMALSKFFLKDGLLRLWSGRSASGDSNQDTLQLGATDLNEPKSSLHFALHQRTAISRRP